MNPDEIAAYVGRHLNLRLDARETAILSRQLEYVKSRTYDVKYPGMQARRFLPVSNEVPSGATSITYSQWDQYGMAKVVANAADDLPLVDVVAQEFTSPIKSLGDAYSYSVQDLRAVAQSGQPLDVMRANAARRAIESAIDEIAANGLPEARMPGFLNHTNVPIIAPDTGTWATATAEEIIADLNKLVNSIITSTKNIHQPDTILLDTASFALLASMPTGADLQRTVLRVFLETNPYIRNVDQWHKLDLADAAGTGPRIVAYARSPEVMELEIPQEFEQFPPQARNLAFVIPCHARIGGTCIKYPLAIAYMDGV
ncbi:MAG: DUF2184 domain-containing protein [Thermoplasmata archaeon]|nr:DUF2184 domain-containing protein [Thermoplasmata archaeon]